MPPLRWHLNVCLAAVCVMLIAPFANSYHYHPIPSFYQEWSAALLGLIAATILLRGEILAKVELPSIALFPLGLIALLLMQFLIGSVELVTQALIFLIYLLWAILLLVVGRTLRQQLGLERLVNILAVALLTGTLLAAGLQGLQLTSSMPGLGIVFPLIRGSGNLGQANHLANYLWLGIASAIYLYIGGRLKRRTFALFALILLASASLTGSRSVLLYASGFTIFSGWAALHYRTPELTRTFRISLLLLPMTLLVQYAFTAFDIGSSLEAPVAGERFFREISGTSQRLQLWRAGMAIGEEHPWLGAGIGQFPWQDYLLVGRQSNGTFLGGEHAHNLFIQLFAEFGLIAPLLALGLGLQWWLGFVRENWQPAHWWVAAVLLIESVHSQLEYPLWYIFFLGIAALALGAGSTSFIRPRITRAGQLIVALMLTLGGITLFNLGRDYRVLERALNGQAQDTAFSTMESLHKESLLSHYVDLVYGHSLTVDRDALQEKILLTRRAIRFSPVERCVFNLAYLLELDGQHEEARLAWGRAVATHPGSRTESLKQLAILAEQYKELKPLLDEVAAQSSR